MSYSLDDEWWENDPEPTRQVTPVTETEQTCLCSMEGVGTEKEEAEMRMFAVADVLVDIIMQVELETEASRSKGASTLILNVSIIAPHPGAPT